LETHLHSISGKQGKTATLPSLIKACERQILPNASAHCPFCNELVQKRERIKTHVGRHLADLSLRALPSTTQYSDSSDPDNDEGDASSTSGEDSAAEQSTDKLGAGDDIQALSPTKNEMQTGEGASVPSGLPVATGTVKWVNDSKGFGFISQDSGEGDIYVHFSSIVKDGFKTLSGGERVEYSISHGPKGLTAVNVRRLSF
jgi:CspA family cold shock protein